VIERPNWDWVRPSQEFGFLGPGDPEIHIRHALAFERVVADCLVLYGSEFRPVSYVDLGTGGGFPGLYIAQASYVSSCVFVEVRQKRARFLAEWIDRLGLSDRVSVLCERAEIVGRGSLRGSVRLVTARAFGGPGVTAECAAPLLRIGGCAVVSDPPDGGDIDRWSARGLRSLGLEQTASQEDGFSFRTLLAKTSCPTRFPRRNGVPRSQPLF
jgi:16S rRNA (guanine527-N7)-methyltransferase